MQVSFYTSFWWNETIIFYIQDLFGGVSALSAAHMQLLNGFSNQFWGWGGEDDDMSLRIRFLSIIILCWNGWCLKWFNAQWYKILHKLLRCRSYLRVIIMYFRHHGLNITRYDSNIGRYVLSVCFVCHDKVQPYNIPTLRLFRARIWEAKNRFPVWRNRFLGIYSWYP